MRKEGKKYLALLAKEIETYNDKTLTYDDLIEHYGEPNTLAACYMEEYDETILRKKINTKKVVLFISLIIVAVFAIISVLFITDFIKARYSYVTREREIVTELRRK